MARDKTDKTPVATLATTATPRKVRGIFGVLEAEAAQEAWELESFSADFMPGMGFGATKEATRWAWLGMQQEFGRVIKKAGRKKEPIKKTTPAKRAFTAWLMCQNLRKGAGLPNAVFSNRELILHCKRHETALGLKLRDRLFPNDSATLEASVSIGKKLLEIDQNWNSKVCEKLLRDSSKTT